MRNKVDYGIDLGTTNSAIARMENGVPVIRKSDTLKDTVPSCVHYNRRKDVLVGDTALNVLKNDRSKALKGQGTTGTNTFIEFKRTMGTSHVYECPNLGKSVSPAELSAEVLMKLKSVIQDENVSSVVITVPAKFLNPQNEATMEAAKKAGFKSVHLLQEPVAAATAYGLSKSSNGYWVVFDFGGGTFDAALIKSEEGILTVKDTDGDNWLGGKNIDEAIVDDILISYLKENYALSEILDDPDKRELLRNAVKPFAEEAKIQLSFKESYNILSNLGDLPFEDENSEEPEIDISLSQKDMEAVVAPIFQRALDITKNLLSRNNLTGSDIGALILVGGPTYSPILRRMLKEQITENVDTSMDPMTVVAKGAALFASTISITEEIVDGMRDRTKIQLDLKYEAATVEMEEMVNIKVLKDKTLGKIPERVFAEITRSDGAWSSGRKLIGEKPSLIDVLLVEGRSNSFAIRAYDEQGNLLECQPEQFSILQGIGGLDGMQVLPYHIGIAKYFRSEGKDLFMPVKGLEKSKKIPATGYADKLKTRSVVRPGISDDKIRVPIYQGDYHSEGTNPILNNFINEAIITGESLPGLLPEGSDVEITIKVDRSQIMTFVAYFPLLNHTEELKIEIKQTAPPDDYELSREIGKAKVIAQKVNDSMAVESLTDLENQLENEKGSADGKLRLLDSLRKVLLGLEDAKKALEWPPAEKELKEAFFTLEELVEKIKENSDDEQINMERLDAYVDEFRTKVEHVMKGRNVREAKELRDEIIQTDFAIRNAVSDNAMDIGFLHSLNNNFSNYHWTDKAKARQLINQGLQLANAGKTSAVRPLLIELIRLMPADERPETLG
jgi:molecular chaperone DnaK